MRHDLVATTLGALIVLLAQIIIAPNIVIVSAMPNFILAYVLVLAITRSTQRSTLVFSFVLGLSYDFLSHGPVGAMALLCVLAAYFVSRVFTVLANDTLFMPITCMVVGAIVVELLYASFMMAFGIETSLLSAFLYKALPCALYDCVIALILYPLALRFLIEQSLPSVASRAETPIHVSPSQKYPRHTRVKTRHR